MDQIYTTDIDWSHMGLLGGVPLEHRNRLNRLMNDFFGTARVIGSTEDIALYGPPIVRRLYYELQSTFDVLMLIDTMDEVLDDYMVRHKYSENTRDWEAEAVEKFCNDYVIKIKN